jgi:hypothetical protein
MRCEPVAHTLNRLLVFAGRVLGAYELQADLSWGHRMSSVLCLRDADGTCWVLKCHGDRARYRAELDAYRDWAPPFEAPHRDCARLTIRCGRSSSQRYRGRHPPGPRPRQAGLPVIDVLSRTFSARLERSCRQLHDAQPASSWPDFAAVKMQQFERLKPAAASLLRPRELDRASNEIAALQEAPRVRT